MKAILSFLAITVGFGLIAYFTKLSFPRMIAGAALIVAFRVAYDEQFRR